MSGERSRISAISAGLSTSLHVLMAVLAAVVLLNAASDDAGRTAVVVVMTIVFAITYGTGVWPTGAIPAPGPRSRWWVAALSLEWLVLLWASGEATYLVFGLFFLYLHLLGGLRGTVVVALSTTVAVIAFGLHRGFDLAGVVGPVVGAGVAIVIGLGHRALTHEVARRQQLIEELTRTRAELARAERAAGVVEERARLAREVHDTLSQSLSSIIMLLYAAQRSEPGSVGGQARLEQAREAAEEALAETRGFIHELMPPSLRTGGIGEALGRLAGQIAEATGLHIEVTVLPDIGPLPAPVEVGVLRIAQSALANVAQHAQATRVDVTLTRLGEEVVLDVVDDGDGFEPSRLGARGAAGRPPYGLVVMEERAAQLGGRLLVESGPGAGTSVVASFAAPA